MCGVSKKRWHRAQKYEYNFQQRKALHIRGNEKSIIGRRIMRARGLCDLLTPFLKFSESTRILEVGSGPHGIVFFLEKGDRFAMDPLADYYHQAFSLLQAGSKAKPVCGRGENIPFPAVMFDLIISDNVLDHTMDPEAVIREIYRVLKPGGVLLLQVNVHRWTGYFLSQIHEKFLGGRWIFMNWFAPHPFYFRYSDVIQLVSKNRFHVALSELQPYLYESDSTLSFLGRLKRMVRKILFHTNYCTVVCLKEYAD